MSVPVTQDPGPCPCGQCEVIGTKIAKVSGHLKGCRCPSCRNRGNRNRGQRTEARRHRNLGGIGVTIRDEHPNTYPLTITTEDKGGAQIPMKFRKFIDSEWTRHAFRQAEKKIPIGLDTYPALYIELGPKRAYLVVRVMDSPQDPLPLEGPNDE